MMIRKLETRNPRPEACAMNPRERWSLLLIDEEPDRLIAYPLITTRAAATGGVSVGDYCHDAAVMARSQIRTREIFDVDGISLFSDVGLLAEAMGSLFFHPGDDVPFLDRPVLSAGEAPRSLRIPGLCDGRMGILVDAARFCHETVGDTVPIFAFVPGPFTTAALLTGLEEFLTDLLLSPDRAAALLDLAARASVPLFDALMVAGALPVIVEPLASGSVISCSTFEEFAAPWILRQVEYLHRFDLDVMLHVCGETEGELDALGETGADLLSLDRVGMDRASRAVGSRCRLVGNVPPTVLLEGSPTEVRDEVERAVRLGRDNPRGFVVSTGCEVPHAAPDENVKAFVETVKEIGGKHERRWDDGDGKGDRRSGNRRGGADH